MNSRPPPLGTKGPSRSSKKKERGCPKSRIAPFAIVYFGKKNYLTVAKKQTL